MIDRKTGKRQKGRPRFIKQDQVAVAQLQTSGVVCIEKFADFQQMGRFTLRDEGNGDMALIWNCYCSTIYCASSKAMVLADKL